MTNKSVNVLGTRCVLAASVFLVFVAVRVALFHLYTYLVVYTNPSDGNIVQMCWVGQSGLLSGD